jgi:hypothetical protein
VLVTYPPYAAAQDRINGYNAVVLSGALGRRRVIDIAAAVTVGGDRVTPIAGYFNADNLHLTVAGHRAVWVWILANAPTCWTVPAQMHSRAGWCPNCGARSSRLRA